MFKQSQLESVKAWLAYPAYEAMPLHARIQRAIRDRFRDTPINAHPILKKLIDSKALRDLGVEPLLDKNGEQEPSNH